jgi:hypothetical protein
MEKNILDFFKKNLESGKDINEIKKNVNLMIYISLSKFIVKNLLKSLSLYSTEKIN